MAITKILPRNARLDAAIRYILNGDKTDNQILTAYFNCDPGWAYRQMIGHEIVSQSAMKPGEFMVCCGGGIRSISN